MKHLVFTLLLLGVAFMASAQHNPVAHPEATVTLGNARFTVLTPQMIRLEWNETGAFVDAATFVAVNRRMPVPEFSTSNEGGEFVLETSELTLTYTGQGAKFTPENTSISFTLNGQSTQWVPGLEDPENLRGTSRTLDGMTGGNDWNGNPIELEPGILSRNGWALIDDSGNFQFDGSDWQWVQAPAEGAQQDWYFLGYGHKYTDALRDYTRMAGSIPMLPRYALGYWWSRYWVYSDPELRQLMQEMRSYGIPIDVLIIDMDWHETFGGLQDIRNPQLDETGHKLGWTGYTWNRNLFPEPERFLQWTEDYHLKTALNLHPASGIAPGEDQYQAFAKRIGFDASSGKYIRYRMADKQWAQTYFDVVLQPMEQQGIDFWWLDWQQEPTSEVVAGLSHTWWLNYTFFTDMERRGEKRPLLFHRWGGLGNHRYQIGFSGDDKIHWESLRYQTYFTPTASNVGYGYWSHDIGGHAASEWSQDPELYLRWLQFGVFSPILRTHSAKMSSVERRFWMYPDYFPQMRDLIKLRYALVPYLYQAAHQAHTTGVSPLRPMYYHHPEEDEAYENPYQYYFGDDMIVAPIADSVQEQNHLATREVWLPEGEWFEWFTGSTLAGGQTYTRSYALHEIPAFVRAGSIIPMYPEVEHLQQEIGTTLLTIIPGGNDTLQYYEDDGKTNGYQEREFAQTQIISEQSVESIKVSIAPSQGSYTGMAANRSFEVHLPNTLPPKSAQLNGKPLAWRYDANSLETVLLLPETARSEALEVVIEKQEIDASLMDGKKGQFARLSYAIGKMKIEVARDSFWATMPNTVLKGEQVPVQIGYHPDQTESLLRAYDQDFPELLKALGGHPNARPAIAQSWVRYLSE